ncbi:hypothetical protein CHLRE_06g307950v5 [Chlamydomonas reinhardtii]|uniref:Large ribosomal subunit protein bL9c n=1 Tax=Chlamydomonas reinhardtii TaxID=3055 RepID=A0A2K3DRF9_CHLRE|nr:uncharacterized protein CHLRE_06g307950v5 [Chlamydomonas reinhardtii]PNW83132.1 hypothetical protein CHLRE_06g307950v5 [Chlamydomonas reinhardtii]7PKT_f Chain f, 50S ribosomal protein L9, chloroplastic [Chlamydomonas reinhardtii]
MQTAVAIGARAGRGALLRSLLPCISGTIESATSSQEAVERSGGLASTSSTPAHGPSCACARCFTSLAFSTTRHASTAAAAKAKGKSSKSSAGRQAGTEAADLDPGLIRVVLRKDVPRLGRRGEVVSVRRGLMRHSLYPAGEAAYATPDNIAKYGLADVERGMDAAAEQQQGGLEKLIKALDTKPVVITRRASDSDPESFAPGSAAVGARAVAAAVESQLGIRLDAASHLFLGEPIRSYGSYKVPLNLRLASEPQRQVELTVHVDRRGKPQQPGATAAAGGGSSGEGGAGAAAGAAGGAGAAASS